MRVPASSYQLEADLAVPFPQLRPAQRAGLALWVLGAIIAGSACQNAVLAALEPLGGAWHATRQRLREWTYAGSERAAPCGTSLDVEACFAPLLRWVLGWWTGDTLPLAIDATTLGKRWVVLAVCVLYRGCAIPVAWHVKPGPGRGHWSIENRVHSVRDVTWGEDEGQVRVGHAPQALAALRNGLLSLLRACGWTQIADATRHYGAFAPRALHFLSTAPKRL